jgi:flagellar export protein FliJ
MPKSFTFRFEEVLEIRRLKEDIAERDLAVAQKAVRAQTDLLLHLRTEEEDGKGTLRSLKQKTLNLVQLRLQEGYLGSVERRIREASSRLRELGLVELDKRRILTEARKDVRVLEKYRDRRLRAWRQEQDREERRFLDEVAQNMTGTGS